MNTNEWRDLPTLVDVAAAQAAGDEIEVNQFNTWVSWHGKAWNSFVKYRARPRKPATKKIKILAWYNEISGVLFWRAASGDGADANWMRVPSEDKEIEVQDD